jgi:FkbM family methyltransferase
VHQVALSDRDGEVTFYETVNDMGFLSSSSSLELTHVKSIDHGVFREQRLQARRLDDWAAENLGATRLKLIKIDVETHENAVLLGGMRTITAHRPVLVVEVLPSAVTEAHNTLLGHGYLDFAIGADMLAQLPAVRYFHGAANHLLCPTERVFEVFALCRSLSLRIDVG